MSVSRTYLTRSPGKITFGGQTFYLRDNIKVTPEPKWEAIMSSLHGRVNYTKSDLVVKITAPVFGEYNTSKAAVMYPSAFTTPTPGASLCSDAALVVQAKNDDRITFHNAFVSGVPNIYLGIDKDLWASDIEFTALIKGGANSEDAAAYWTRDTNSYTDTGFALTNFKRQRYSLAWGSIANWTSFELHEGVNLGIDIDVQYDISANHGTVNAYVGENGLIARCSGIPLNSLANLDTLARDQGNALGSIGTGTAGTHSADLVITGSGVSITLKNAFMEKRFENFGIKPLRMGEVGWISTSGFTTGTRAAEIVIA